MKTAESIDPRVMNAVEAASAILHVPTFAIFGSGRGASHCEARQVAMFACRQFHHMTFDAIGHAFDRDHTTVVHACQTITRRMKVDEQLAAVVRLVLSKQEPVLKAKTPAQIIGVKPETLEKIRLAIRAHPELVNVVLGGAA